MDKCPNCDKELIQIPQKRKKLFCNSTCRSNFWHKAKRKVKKINKTEESKYHVPNKDVGTMPEGLHWKEQLEWKRNHEK